MFLSVMSLNIGTSLFLSTLLVIVLVDVVSVHMYVPVVSRLGPEALAGRLSIQEPLQGAVGAEDITVYVELI